MEENLEQLEATYGAPASLFERSAAARAKASGSTTEAVVAMWVGEEANPREESPGEETPVVDKAESAPAAALSGAALLSAVAEARGMPESLIERSAKARASAAGGSVEDVLQEWAAEEGLVQSPADKSPGAAASADAGPRSPVEDAASPGDGEGLSLSGPALLAAVAEARGMPESLVERSASARAKTAGVDVDAVLRDWAEEEGLAVGVADESSGEQSPDAAASADAGRRSPVEDTPVATGALSGAALLSAVAVARKMPESLVERSAKARAKQTGGTPEEVLLEWAAEEGVAVGVADESPDDAASADAGRRSPVAEPEDLEEISDAAAADTAPAPKAVIPSPPEPEPVEESEPEEPESPRTRYPAWLAAVLVVIPLLAVLYLVVVPNQPTCGSAGQLAVDPATGVAVSCDGGEYGVDDVSNFSIGATVYEEACAVCHGADGGGGAGPAMAGGVVLENFPAPSCATQIEWIALGSSDWPDATYGANDTPVAGGMPGFEGQLTELEIAQVTLYERVAFGGLEIEATETECGLGIEEG